MRGLRLCFICFALLALLHGRRGQWRKGRRYGAVARNKAKNKLRQCGHTLSLEDDILDLPDEYEPINLLEKEEEADLVRKAVDSLRERFGDKVIRRAILLEDPDLTGDSLYETHTVHPTGFSGKTDEIGGKE